MTWLSNHRWAALGLAVSAAYWPGIIQSSFVPRWAVIAIGMPCVSRLDPRTVPESIRWSIVFLLGIATLGLMNSPFWQAGVGDLIFIVILSLTFVGAAALDSLDDVMLGLGAGLGISSALAITQYWHIWNPVPEVSIPSGLFFNSEVLGEFSALIFVWAMLRPRRAIAAIALVPIILTGTRIGMLAAVVALVYSVRLNWRALIPVAMLCTAAGAYALLFFKLGDSMHRITLWGATILAFNPIGNGLGWGSAAFPFEEFSHSDVLQALSELGVAAIVLAVIPFIAFRGNRGNNAERALFVAVCVECFVSFPLHFPASGFVAAVVAGFLVGRGAHLRDRSHLRPIGDEPRRFWRGDAAATDARRSQRLGDALSLRSIPDGIAALCPGQASPDAGRS